MFVPASHCLQVTVQVMKAQFLSAIAHAVGYGNTPITPTVRQSALEFTAASQLSGQGTGGHHGHSHAHGHGEHGHSHGEHGQCVDEHTEQVTEAAPAHPPNVWGAAQKRVRLGALATHPGGDAGPLVHVNSPTRATFGAPLTLDTGSNESKFA